MRRQAFHNQLMSATFQALIFGQKFVKNTLSADVIYLVRLNQSCDDSRSDDEMVYPEDDGRIEVLNSSIDVVELLCRNEECPQWIDISVFGSDKHKTLLKLECCGRFHSDENRMYYFSNGTHPFGIKSPYLRPWLKPSQKFSLPSTINAIKSARNNVHPYSFMDKIRLKLCGLKNRIECESEERMNIL